MTSENSRNPKVLAALTLLYGCSTLGLVRQWDGIVTLIGIDGQSLVDIFTAPSLGFGTSIIAKELAVDMGLVVADVLLVSQL